MTSDSGTCGSREQRTAKTTQDENEMKGDGRWEIGDVVVVSWLICNKKPAACVGGFEKKEKNEKRKKGRMETQKKEGRMRAKSKFRKKNAN